VVLAGRKVVRDDRPFVSLPSLGPISAALASASSAPFGPLTVKISSLVVSSGDAGVHEIWNVNSASTRS
jgi:hypothetical protein